MPVDELADRMARLLANEPVLNNNAHVWACIKMGWSPNYVPNTEDPIPHGPEGLAYHAHCAAYRATLINKALGLLVNLESGL
jgi:hypothetical protein